MFLYELLVKEVKNEFLANQRAVSTMQRKIGWEWCCRGDCTDSQKDVRPAKQNLMWNGRELSVAVDYIYSTSGLCRFRIRRRRPCYYRAASVYCWLSTRMDRVLRVSLVVLWPVYAWGGGRAQWLSKKKPIEIKDKKKKGKVSATISLDSSAEAHYF